MKAVVASLVLAVIAACAPPVERCSCTLNAPPAVDTFECFEGDGSAIARGDEAIRSGSCGEGQFCNVVDGDDEACTGETCVPGARVAICVDG